MKRLFNAKWKNAHFSKRLFKSSISVLTAFSILISGLPLGCIVKANAASSSGTGTASDPYIITSADQLASISTTGLDKCYKLGNNLDLSGYANWTPIGNDTRAFTGTFDGSGHTISNLTIGTGDNPSNLSYAGLFGESYGTIRNVGLRNVSIYSTGNNIGALVGEVYGGRTITNTYATGNVSGRSYVGGLIGYVSSDDAVISGSYATDAVKGSKDGIGGLVGKNGYNDGNYHYGASIINCYADGGVAGSSYIGGLVGTNDGTITNSYATGNATGSSCVGGLVGSNTTNTITNCYATGKVSGNSSIGSFAGINYGKITNGYWWKSQETSRE